MGADFKEKAKKSFEKCWDRAAVEANTPDLFCRNLENAPNRFEAEAIGNAAVLVGESLPARVEDGTLVGRRGVSPVLRITNPGSSLLSSIGQGCNIARVDVVAADPISGVLEVTIS